jgi:hypothetical protein
MYLTYESLESEPEEVSLVLREITGAPCEVIDITSLDWKNLQ